MGKKLAIIGHPTRGNEVIKLLEMMGGKNCYYLSGLFTDYGYYFIGGPHNDEICGVEYIFSNEDICLFTLEEFLEKFPYKVGDKVHIYVQSDDIDGRYNIDAAEITSIKWNPAICKIAYKMKNINREFYKEEIKCKADDSNKPTNKKTDNIKLSDNKCERTHEDVIFDSIIWHLRNSVNNGKQNLSGGECEDYFRELVKKNNENKMSDCKKCGLVFGSVRCFDKDCPHNTPKSYAVGLKDGEIIECGVNKEIVMNENKPLFKTGDVVKLKGCPVKNLFWIVVDVVEDGYIFNDGEKYSFDDQHHYEKSNREVINTQPNITAEVTDKNNCNIECPYGYEFYDENGNIIGTKVLMRPKKPIYPTTYEECYDESNTELHFIYVDKNERDLYESFIQLIRCRNAYWKIAGEQLGLGKPWEPDWKNETQVKYIITTFNNELEFFSSIHSYVVGRRNHILSFPTAEMRDAFYENFQDLIESCKELL